MLFDFRKRDALALEPQERPPTPDAQLDTERLARRVDEAFGGLTEAHREVLLLAAVEGLPHAEIAVVLGIREYAVRKRLSRARAELAAALEKLEASGGARR